MHSSRSKAQSEPEFRPLQVHAARPSSSYDPSGIRSDPGISFDSKVVEFIAAELGIDLETSPCTWIVRDCLLRLFENNWLIEGSVFRHKISGEKRSTNEIVDIHRELARRVIHDSLTIARNRLDPYYRIREAIFNDFCDAGFIFSNLNLHAKNEQFLVPIIDHFLTRVRTQIKNKQHMYTIDSCCDIVELQTLICLERVLQMKQKNGLVFCIHCTKKFADGICFECNDAFCSECEILLHKSKAHRLDHLFVFFDQCVCSECVKVPAIVRCVDCCDLFCSLCFQSVHAAGQWNQLHLTQLASAPMCFHCRARVGEIICVDCSEVYCQECTKILHRKSDHHNRKRISHKSSFNFVRQLADQATIPYS